jgi:hypothetical protein
MSNTDKYRFENTSDDSASGVQASAGNQPKSVDRAQGNSRPAPDAAYRPQYEEDTISLIDLVAVVVRHRVMIIGGTLLVGVLVTVALYVGPLVGWELGPQAHYTAEQQVAINALPPEVEDFVSVDIPTTIQSLLTQPSLVGDVFRSFEERPPRDRSPERYLTMIRQDVIGNRYVVNWDADTRTITLQYSNGSREDAVAFLQEMLAMVAPEVVDHLGPRFSDAADSLEISLRRTREDLVVLANETLLQLTESGSDADLPALMEAVDRSGGVTLRSLADIERAVVRLETLSQDSSNLFSPVGQPVVFEDDAGTRSMVVIISTITAFFLTVFLAFVLEYIRRVQAEPEEMAKLESAWHRK